MNSTTKGHVIRVANHKDGYTVITNETLQDSRLSWGASGLLAYLLSMPTDWHVNEVQLAAERDSAGRDKVRRMLRELQDAGYLQRKLMRDGRGRVIGSESTVTEVPVMRIDTASRPMTEKPILGEPTSAEPITAKSPQQSNVVNKVHKKPSRRRSAGEPKPLWDAFCKVWSLPADAGRYKGLAGEWDRDVQARADRDGLTTDEILERFRDYYRESTTSGDWGKYVASHNCREKFLAWLDCQAPAKRVKVAY